LSADKRRHTALPNALVDLRSRNGRQKTSDKHPCQTSGFSLKTLDIISVWRYNDAEVFAMLTELLEQKNITKYRLAKQSGIPHTTVLDICSGRTKIEKCSGKTLYKLAQTLNVSMETLVTDAMECCQSGSDRANFEIFKSNICHLVHHYGDAEFVIDTLQSGKIRALYNKKWYPEALYLLAMTDYLCRENNVPVCSDYDDLRRAKLAETLYPEGVHTLCYLLGSDKPKADSLNEAIPEFLRHNIVEAEVRNVC
jgi:transcriptional regulator with XRE-family HTH domain